MVPVKAYSLGVCVWRGVGVEGWGWGYKTKLYSELPQSSYLLALTWRKLPKFSFCFVTHRGCPWLTDRPEPEGCHLHGMDRDCPGPLQRERPGQRV